MASFAPAKAAACTAKWPSLFCMHSRAPCLIFDRRMDAEKDKQRHFFVRDTRRGGLAVTIKHSYYLLRTDGQLFFYRLAEIDSETECVYELNTSLLYIPKC